MADNQPLHSNDLTNHITELEATMHEAQQFRTLEEQVEDMKRRGINPRENFDKWDKEDGTDENWGSNDVGEVKLIQMDDGEEPTPPPFV